MADRPFCASSLAAQALPGGEFWEMVFHRYTREHGDIDPYEGEPGELQGCCTNLLLTRSKLVVGGPVDIAPCAVCGVTDYCGYDQEGRPWIHADCAEDDDG